MKKLLLFFALLAVSVSVKAAKAQSGTVTVKQSDGSLIRVILHGDEHFSYSTTDDGVLLVQEGNSYYIAKVKQDGTLASTAILAHDSQTRNAEEVLAIEKQDKSRFYAYMDSMAERFLSTRAVPAANPPLFPHTGSPKAIVILVEFQDVPFTLTNPRKSFYQYLNGEGKPVNYGHNEDRNHGSVKQYFTDMSFGTYTPQFDVYGPVKLSQPLKHYGGDVGGVKDVNVRDMVTEACTLMDDSLDFSRYDSNHDGYADLVYLIYSGYSQSINGNSTDCIWPKVFSVPERIYDGVKVARAGLNNELIGFPGAFKKSPLQRINGIGLFCHEFSHCMGLPDFYPTYAPAQGDNQGMEDWSLMDGGEYVNNGYTPTAYTAWEREAFDWMSVETLSETTNAINIQPIDKGGKAYRIVNDNDASGNEYFMMENIQQTGWNEKQRGHGLLIYHVNYDSYLFSLTANAVNNIKGKPRMTVVPADGLLNSSYVETNRDKLFAQYKGDPFPGTSGIHTFNDAMNLPNIKPYHGSKWDKSLTGITEDTHLGLVTFNFIKGTPTAIDMPTTGNDVENDRRIFTLDGRYMGTDITRLPKGIYIRNKEKIVIP